MKKQNSVVKYVKDSAKELSKVTWLTKDQAIKLTIIVFGFCIVTALALGLIDLGLTEIFERYLLKSK